MRYDKLVRDRIAEILAQEGKQYTSHRADDTEYFKKLKEKLQEEVHEFVQSREVEELADILEVVYALAGHLGSSREQLDHVRQTKLQERGAFAQRIILEEVTGKE